MTKKLHLIFAAHFLAILCFGQNGSLNKSQDSTNEVFLNSQSKLLQNFEQTRIKDSLKRIELNREIEKLSTSDNFKKQDLLKELEELKNKNASILALKKHKIDSLKKFIKGNAVVPFLEDTHFYIYNKLGSLTSKQRALAIIDRIHEVGRISLSSSDSLKLISAETTIDIVFDDLIVMSISENDALWQNTSKEELAIQYLKKINESINAFHHNTSWQSILTQIGLALFVILLLGALIYLITRFFRYAEIKIIEQKEKYLRGN